MQIIARGAEAVIYLDDNKIIKERVKKGYRLPVIDESIRKRRTRLEARLMREARRCGVQVPGIISEERYRMMMEYIAGKKIRDAISKKNMRELCVKIGEGIAKLHSNNITHGDLTTSNMILSGDDVFFIDFGLGFQSRRIEDKATDLRLLRQALDSTHYEIAKEAWKIILKAYQNNCSDADGVLKALSKIEKRGRYSKRTNVK